MDRPHVRDTTGNACEVFFFAARAPHLHDAPTHPSLGVVKKIPGEGVRVEPQGEEVPPQQRERSMAARW